MGINRRLLIKRSLCSLFTTPALANVASEAANKNQWQKEILNSLNKLNNKPREINCLIPNGCQKNLAPLVTILAEKTSINLKLSVAPVDDINTQLLLNTAGNATADDLALPATFGLPNLARSNAIQPLDQFAQIYQPQGFQQDALYTLGDYVNDKLYGYQTDGDTYLMFFNSDFLNDETLAKRYADTFGNNLAIPQTWEELDRQMQFFHQPDKGRYGGSLFRTPDYLPWEWWVRFHAKGYFPLADDLEPKIDNAAGVQALEELIAASQFLSPGCRSNGLFQNWHEYSQGNSYCNIGWGGTQKYLNAKASQVRGKLQYSPLPGGIIGGETLRIPYFNWGWNYTVTAGAAYPEAAYLCALLAVSPQISTLSVRENGYFDPFREAHYKDATIQAMYSNDFLSAHRQSMRHSIPDFYLIGQSKYMSYLKKYLHRAEIGEISPKKALQTVANYWRNLHHRYGIDAQAAIWQKIKRRYPKRLQALLN